MHFVISKEALTKTPRNFNTHLLCNVLKCFVPKENKACYKVHIFMACWTCQTCHVIYLTSVLVIFLFPLIVLNQCRLICYLLSVEL
jgi:hypothetical protein